MKSRKNLQGKIGSIVKHIIFTDFSDTLEQHLLLKKIMKQHAFHTVSIIGNRKPVKGIDNKRAQVVFYHSLDEVKGQYMGAKGQEKILITSLNSSFEKIRENIAGANAVYDILFREDKTGNDVLVVKSFIFNTVHWSSNQSVRDNLYQYLREHWVETKNYKVSFEKDGETFNSISKAFNIKYMPRMGMQFKSLFIQPLKGKGIFYQRQHATYKEAVVFRFLFMATCLVLFILLPVMSLNTGISGDEEKHVEQAGKVYNYFKTHGEDQSYLVCAYGPFYAYNISFDVLLHVFIQTFDIDNIYEFRHAINALTGFLTMLFCGLLVVYLAGWRAGFMALLLLFFSPRFLGHTYNNPKDIPFALCYIFTLYYIIKFINHLPKISIKQAVAIALGIGATLNVRIGGLILIAYLFLFTALFIINHYGIKGIWGKNTKHIATIVLTLAAVSAVGYFIGIVFWPFGMEDPIKNPFESLKIMTNFKVSIRQIYEGKVIWSDNVPWYYTLKYILISAPISVLAGMLVTFLWLKSLVEKYGWLNIFMLAFSFIFPLFYIIYKKSNVYGGWRHMIFAYVMMVVFVSIGINHLFNIIQKKHIKYVLLVILLLLQSHAMRHIIKNHPYQYIYYNQLVGGVKGAFGKYETDYYYHSLKEGADWLTQNYLEKDTAQTIKVATNASTQVSYYLRHEKNASVSYVRYYERGNSDWDYAIIANSYINPAQLTKGTWPPENTIHTIDVDGMPICAILKREQKYDYKGFLSLQKKDYSGAISNLAQAIQLDKNDEIAYLNLATAYLYTGQFDKAKSTVAQLLNFYPNYSKGLNLLGLVYYNQRKPNEALQVFNTILRRNPKFTSAYHNKGLVLLAMNKKNEAIKMFQKAIRTNKKFKPSYLAIAKILNQNGKKEQAKKFLDAADQIK